MEIPRASIAAELIGSFKATHAVALRGDGLEMSYAELDRRSSSIAAAIAMRGLGPESLVALALPRSERLVCWVLGCWRAGAAFLPLDPDYPAERLGYMVEDAHPALVVCDRDAPSWAPHASVSEELERQGETALSTPDPALFADGLAYVIYTSGSTGKPKGVEVSFRGLLNLAHNQIRDFAIDSESHVLQFASPSFDAFVAEMLSALVARASLVIGSSAALRPGPELIAFCQRQQVSVATLPPSLLAILDPADFASLRTVVSAGEACTAEIVRRWTGTERRFVNAYGPTESTVCATEGILTAKSVDRGPPSIGTALLGVEALVLDQALRPTDPESIGELFVSGIGLARGYRGRPDLTAERFRPHPSGVGARIYRTGDLVRQNANGELWFRGRSDDQIKLRGFRIELGEVENALNAVPGVADAVAVVSRSPAGDSLTAHVVPRGAATLTVAALRAELAKRLPQHMIPDSILLVAALPRSPNGKVDRRALARSASARPSSWPPPIPPRDDEEAAIVQLFRAVLGIAECGVTDDFFALGGHSIAAALLLTRLAKHEERALDLEVLMTNRTARALAAHRRASHPETSSLPPCIVTLSAGSPSSSAPPLFLLHPVSGNVSCYLPVAAAAGGERRVYGVQSHAFCGQASVGSSFAAMCQSYVEPIRAVCPEGPYLLGGWSVGGSIAVEVARHLANAGADVPLVLLLDAWSPSLHARPAPVLDEALLSYLFIKNNIGRVNGMDLEVPLAELTALDAKQRLDKVRSWAVEEGLYPTHATADELSLLVDVFSHVLRMFIVYDAIPYDGRVLHIQATEPAPGHPRPPTLGWEQLLAHCEDVAIPNTSHYTFISPAVIERFAPMMLSALREASK